MRYVAGLFPGVVGGPSQYSRTGEGREASTDRASFGARCEMGKREGRGGGGGGEGAEGGEMLVVVDGPSQPANEQN